MKIYYWIKCAPFVFVQNLPFFHQLFYSFQININYAAFHGAQSQPLPEPSKDECNAPEDFCSRSGYCQKNSDGVCTWGAKGDCY